MNKIRCVNSQKVNRKLFLKEEVPFKGISTYKDTYQPYILDVRHSSSMVPSPPPIKFDGSSTYHDEYRGFTIRQELRSSCPVDSLPVPRASTGRSHFYYDPERREFI